MSEFLSHYMEILSDPAHLAVEVTLMLLVDVLFLGMVWPFIKRHFHRDIEQEHQRLDREHGVLHEDEPSEAAKFLSTLSFSDEPYDYERQGI